jgi:hypothetical protein
MGWQMGSMKTLVFTSFGGGIVSVMSDFRVAVRAVVTAKQTYKPWCFELQNLFRLFDFRFLFLRFHAIGHDFSP